MRKETGLDPATVERLAGQAMLVTGAGGFIGRRLVAALAAAGAKVTALVRSRRGAAAVAAPGARIAVADLRRAGPLAEAMAGQRVVLNFAHDMRAGTEENLAAFDAMQAAAWAAGVERIVHASSVVVYDDWPKGRLLEAAAITPPVAGADYRRAKIEMERRLMAGPLAAAILQPTIVYGPGSPLWTEAPLATLGRGATVVLPDPPGLCPAVFVGDAVQAALRAAALEGLGRERFLVSGPDRPSWAELFEGYQRLAGRGAVRLEPRAALEARLGPPPPPGVAPAVPLAARASGLLRRLVGHGTVTAAAARLRSLAPSGPVYPDRAMLALYAARPDIDISRAAARLGYSPGFDFNSGLREIGKHLQFSEN